MSILGKCITYIICSLSPVEALLINVINRLTDGHTGGGVGGYFGQSDSYIWLYAKCRQQQKNFNY